MKNFSTWTLETIRKDTSRMSWMEERRFEWIPLAANAIHKLIDGHTFLLVTDREREWFARYTLSNLNKPTNNRPFLPIVSLGTVFPYLDTVRDRDSFDMLEDMLSLSFPNGYTFFYIGKSTDARAQIAKRRSDSFLWIMDEHLQNSFRLDSQDEILDIKLIQLLRLFDKSIDAILFAEVDTDSVV